MGEWESGRVCECARVRVSVSAGGVSECVSGRVSGWASVRVCECASERMCGRASGRVCECAGVRVCEWASGRVECASASVRVNE